MVKILSQKWCGRGKRLLEYIKKYLRKINTMHKCGCPRRDSTNVKNTIFTRNKMRHVIFAIFGFTNYAFFKSAFNHLNDHSHRRAWTELWQWRGVTSHGGWRRTPPVRASLSASPLLLSAVGQHKAAAGMEPAVAYGAAKAGSVSFDPVAFFKHPRTILRLLCWVSLLWNVRAGVDEQACLHPHLSVWVSFTGSLSLQTGLLEITIFYFFIIIIYETINVETPAVGSRIVSVSRNKILGVISAVQLVSAAPEAHYHMFIQSLFMSGWSSFGFKYPLSSRLQLFIFALWWCCSFESDIKDQFVLKQAFVCTLVLALCLWPFLISQFCAVSCF